MSMGITSEEDFQNEISNLKPISPSAVVIDKPINGRGEGNIEVPDSLRKIIGETSEIEGRKEALALAKQFNISDSSVSAYSQGATSTASYNEPKSSIRQHINRAKERISKKARSKLDSALNNITDEKLENAKLKDVALVARAMSGIIKDMEPDPISREQDKERPQFVVFAPQLRDERHYEIVVARD